jgi:hypothetical protein
MQKVTMLLAYRPDLPQGDTSDGLDLYVLLTPQGQLDEAAFAADPSGWRARRFRADRPDRSVELVRLEERWALRSVESDDAPVWPFAANVFRPGEYVTLCPPAEPERIYRIVNVEPE